MSLASFEYLQPYVLPVFLGVVAGALAIWNVRLTSEKSNLEDELDATLELSEVHRQLLNEAGHRTSELEKKLDEAVSERDELAKNNEDLEAQNKRFVGSILTLSKKIPKRDEQGRFKPKKAQR